MGGVVVLDHVDFRNGQAQAARGVMRPFDVEQAADHLGRAAGFRERYLRADAVVLGDDGDGHVRHRDVFEDRQILEGGGGVVHRDSLRVLRRLVNTPIYIYFSI